MRYKDAEDSAPTQWTVTATKTEKRNGIKIRVASKVSWKRDNGDWTWLRATIKDIRYNVQ